MREKGREGKGREGQRENEGRKGGREGGREGGRRMHMRWWGLTV